MAMQLATHAGKPANLISARLQRALVAGVCLLGTIGAFAATNLIGSVIVSGGNTAQSPGNCYRLTASVGQSDAGSLSSGGTFSLQGGFLAGHGDKEPIFHQGFEVCS